VSRPTVPEPAAHPLCRLEDIPDGGSAGFDLPCPDGDEPVAVMALRRGERVFAYVNWCPHWGSPLDLVPGRFLTRDGQHVLCTTHGALFRIEDGRCVKGPCLGASLRPVPCRVEDETVIADTPPDTYGWVPA